MYAGRISGNILDATFAGCRSRVDFQEGGGFRRVFWRSLEAGFHGDLQAAESQRLANLRADIRRIAGDLVESAQLHSGARLKRVRASRSQRHGGCGKRETNEACHGRAS